MSREGSHLGEGGLGEILVNGIEVSSEWGGGGGAGCGGVGGGRGAGLEFALLSEEEGAIVTVEESCDDGSGLSS